jgi:predicted nucleotidyltransferase
MVVIMESQKSKLKSQRLEVKQEIEKAKQIIRNEIETAGFKIKRILLFGSRAKGKYTEESDWDFYVIIDKELNHKERWEITRKINGKLIEHEIPNDIIINSSSWAEKYKNDVGRITYYALKYGVEV